MTIKGTPSYTTRENRTDNNTATVDIGLANLALQASQPRVENGTWICDLSVTNTGYERASASTIKVFGGNASGVELSTLGVDALDSGENASVSYAIPTNYLHVSNADTLNALQFTLTSETEERDYGDNEARIVFGNLVESNWTVVKESNSTIRIDCNDTTIGGQFYLGIYDVNGKFLDVQVQNANQSVTRFEISNANADHVAVFWLDDNLRPLEAATRFSVK